MPITLHGRPAGEQWRGEPGVVFACRTGSSLAVRGRATPCRRTVPKTGAPRRFRLTILLYQRRKPSRGPSVYRQPRYRRRFCTALGQQHFHAHALAGLALDRKLATMTIDDVLDDGQTQAGALLLAAGIGIDAVEALGQPRHMFGLHTLAVVDHRDHVLETGAAGWLEADVDEPAARAIFDGIVEQVLEHLIELAAIANGGRGPRKQIEPDVDFGGL